MSKELAKCTEKIEAGGGNEQHQKNFDTCSAYME